MAGFLIESIDVGNSQFRRQLKKLDPAVLAEVFERIALLPRQDPIPPGLHVHQLKSRTVRSALESELQVPVWTMHATANDSCKASFTVEKGVAYFRTLGAHDEVDKAP
ncbi:hypothetical protein [Rhizobacter sp. P5_C2]